MHRKLNRYESDDSDELKYKNKLSRENAQLHALCESLARVLKKYIDDPNMKYFWTSADHEALIAYEKFKDDVIWKNQ